MGHDIIKLNISKYKIWDMKSIFIITLQHLKASITLWQVSNI